MLFTLFCFVFGIIGTLILVRGHREHNDYFAVTEEIVAGIILTIAILWLGELLGFNTGFDLGTFRFITLWGTIILATALAGLKIERIIKRQD